MPDVLEELKRVADKYDMKIKSGEGIIKLYSNNVDAINLALFSLNDIMELAYTTAEHHPYWGMLYNSIEIVKILLESWDEELSSDAIDEISWRLEEVRNMIDRLR